MLQGTSVYTLAFVGQRLASLILLPITTRFLTTSEYGVGDLVEQISGVMGILLGLYYSSALGYFYFKAESDEERRSVVWTSLLGAGLIGAMASVLCLPLAGTASRLVFGSDMAVGYLWVAFLLFGPGFFLEALFSWLRVADRQGMYVVGALFRVAITILGMVMLVAVFRLRVWGVLWTSAAAILLTALLLGWNCFRIHRPSFDLQLFIRMAKFTAPIGLTGTASFVINTGDRLILPHYVPLGQVGIYVLAYKLGMLVSMVFSSFGSYWGAQAFQIMKRDDADSVFARLFSYVVLGVAFCGLGIVVAARPALTILAAPAFRGAAAIVPLIVAAYCIRSIGDFLRVLFVVAGRTGSEAICTWMGAAICIAGYLILIPRYGIWGAAAATNLAFLALTAVTAAWTYRLRPYRVQAKRLSKIGIALVAGLGLYLLLPPGSLPQQIGVATLSVAIFPLMLWLLRFPTAGELQVCRSALASFAQRGLGSRSRGGLE